MSEEHHFINGNIRTETSDSKNGDSITAGAGVLTAKIINGENAYIGTVPFVVFLNLKLESGSEYLCGASIISERWVITAAHCVIGDTPDPYCEGENCKVISSYIHSPTTITFVAGEFHLRNIEGHEQQRSVDLVIAHPEYDTIKLKNDIALLRVDTPFEFNSAVSAVSLAEQIPPPGTKLHIAGWGITETGSTASELRNTETSVISDADCSYRYAGGLKEGMWCSGSAGMNFRTAGGDSGGPVYFYMDSKPYLAGLTSWGPEKEKGEAYLANDYDVNTNVSHFKSWITSSMANGIQAIYVVSESPEWFNYTSNSERFHFKRVKLSCSEENCRIHIKVMEMSISVDKEMKMELYHSDGSKMGTVNHYHNNNFGVSIGFASKDSSLSVVFMTGDKAVDSTISLQYSIYNNTFCSDSSRRCDEVNDCADLSDEIGCTYPDKANFQRSSSAAGCYPGDLLCSASSYCIRSDKICDGYVDCDNFADEKCGAAPHVISVLLLLGVTLFILF